MIPKRKETNWALQLYEEILSTVIDEDKAQSTAVLQSWKERNRRPKRRRQQGFMEHSTGEE